MFCKYWRYHRTVFIFLVSYCMFRSKPEYVINVRCTGDLNSVHAEKKHEEPMHENADSTCQSKYEDKPFFSITSDFVGVTFLKNYNDINQMVCDYHIDEPAENGDSNVSICFDDIPNCLKHVDDVNACATSNLDNLQSFKALNNTNDVLNVNDSNNLCPSTDFDKSDKQNQPYEDESKPTNITVSIKDKAGDTKNDGFLKITRKILKKYKNYHKKKRSFFTNNKIFRNRKKGGKARNKANLDCLLQNKIKTRRLLASRKPNTRKSVIDKNEPFTAKQSNNVLTSGKQLQVITSTNLNAISAEQNAMSYNNHNDFTNKKKRILQCNNLCPNLKIKNSDSEFQLKSTTELKHNNESSSTQITEKTQTCIDHYEYNKNTNRYIYISKKCTRNRVLPLDQYKIVTTKIRDLAMPILESLDLIEYVNNISILEQSSSTDTNYYFHIYKITSINNLDYKPTVDYVVRIISNNNQYKLRIAEEKAVAKKIIKNDHYKILYQHYANFTLVTQLFWIFIKNAIQT